MVRFGVPGQNVDALSYADGRLATVPAIQSPRRPTTEDKKFPMWCEWRVNKEAVAPALEGEFWKLVRFESNGDATWILFGNGSTGPAISIETDDGAPNVVPDGFGEVQILGGAGIAVTGQGPGQAVTVALSGGAIAADQFDVDFATVPGVDPVVPTAGGQVSIVGRVISNTPANLKAISSHSTAANQFNVDVQLAAAVAATPADPFDVGLASFDNSHFSVDSNGFAKILFPFGPADGAYNLSITVNAGTGVVSIQAADGTALSAIAPGYITIASKSSPGQKVTIPITANQSFIDDRGASEIIGNLFGLTTGVAHTAGMVFWIYAVLNDDEDTIQFMISRSAQDLFSPAAADIGAPDDAVADKQSSFWSFDNIDETLYDSNPALIVGSLLCTMSASDDWTVGDPGNQFGIGLFGGQKLQTLKTGQFGAASGTFFADNGGTAPVADSATNYLYQVNPLLNVTTFYLYMPITTQGVGAVTAKMAFPYIVGPNSGTNYNYACIGSFFDSSAGTWSVIQMHINDDTQLATFWLQGASAAMLNTDWDASDILQISGTLPISTNN